jgi:hypothetical protein
VEGIYYYTNFKEGDKTDCNNYRRISFLSTAYKILSDILLARLTPYVNEIIGDHRCGFRRIRFSTVGRYWREKWEYNGNPPVRLHGVVLS